jgi:hypothetical protein
MSERANGPQGTRRTVAVIAFEFNASTLTSRGGGMAQGGNSEFRSIKRTARVGHAGNRHPFFFFQPCGRRPTRETQSIPHRGAAFSSAISMRTIYFRAVLVRCDWTRQISRDLPTSPPRCPTDEGDVLHRNGHDCHGRETNSNRRLGKALMDANPMQISADCVVNGLSMQGD